MLDDDRADAARGMPGLSWQTHVCTVIMQDVGYNKLPGSAREQAMRQHEIAQGAHLIRRTVSNPASNPAASVASACPSLKYAGT